MEPITNFDNFSFRSHYMGDLMTPAREKSNLEKYNETLSLWQAKTEKMIETKNKTTATYKKDEDACERYKSEIARLEPIRFVPKLSTTCKTRLIQIYTEATTGRIKSIKNDFIEKGLHVEDDVISMYSLKQNQFFKKNQIRKDNGFINGMMDFEESEDVSVDAKANWDIFTYDKVAISELNKMYEWQGHCYMWLFNKKTHRVAYGLVDTPEFLIKGQLKKIEYDLPEEMWDAAKKEVMKLNIYSDLPLKRKLRVISFNRNDDKIDQIKLSVPKWRDYLNNINNDENEQLEDDE